MPYRFHLPHCWIFCLQVRLPALFCTVSACHSLHLERVRFLVCVRFLDGYTTWMLFPARFFCYRCLLRRTAAWVLDFIYHILSLPFSYRSHSLSPCTGFTLSTSASLYSRHLLFRSFTFSCCTYSFCRSTTIYHLHTYPPYLPLDADFLLFCLFRSGFCFVLYHIWVWIFCTLTSLSFSILTFSGFFLLFSAFAFYSSLYTLHMDTLWMPFLFRSFCI